MGKYKIHFLILILIIILFLLIKKHKFIQNINVNDINDNINDNVNNNNNNNVIESFIDGNFKLCKEGDCKCLKLNRAPDGQCVKYKVAKKPSTPEYKDKKLYMDHVVRNNLYPLKRNLDILIFVGRRMKDIKKRFSKSPPSMLSNLQNIEKNKHSMDPKTQSLFLVFNKANRILKYFNEGNEPYIKYLVIDMAHGGESREVLNAYGISDKITPMIYLINEATKEKKYFKCDPMEDKCYLLKDLMIFIANGDLGLISYLNHLHDPFSGIEFRHDSRKNEWYHKNPGLRVHEEGTEMCKLIDYRDLPNDIMEKVEK